MSGPRMKRMESRKSHSWWWDSHISPKNNKWLAENLEEMDQCVKKMLKLIEEDNDTFAKKAEMYYRKRPILVSNVEEFYRMYRALAEKYDNLTGELRKSIPSDLKSQSSSVSDCGSETASAFPSPYPSRKTPRRRSGNRGFQFFLGSVGGKSEDSSSASSDSDSGSVYSGPPPNGDGLQRKLVELEVELHDVKEKLRITEEKNLDILSKIDENCNHGELLDRITWYEEELKVSNERLHHSEEELSKLKIEFQKNVTLASTFHAQLEFSRKEVEAREAELNSEITQVSLLQKKIVGLETNASGVDKMIGKLEKELDITNKKLEDSEEEVARLNAKLRSTGTSQKSRDVPALDTELMNRDLKIAALEEELGLLRNEKLQLLENEINDEITNVKQDNNESLAIPTGIADLQAQLEAAQKHIKMLESEIHELKVAISDARKNLYMPTQSSSSQLSSESRKQYEASKLKEDSKSFGMLWTLFHVKPGDVY